MSPLKQTVIYGIHKISINHDLKGFMPISEDSSQLRRIHFSDMRAPFIMKNQSVYLLLNLDNHPPGLHVMG